MYVNVIVKEMLLTFTRRVLRFLYMCIDENTHEKRRIAVSVSSETRDVGR